MRGFPFLDTHLIFIFFDTLTNMGDIVFPISHTHLIYMSFASGAEIIQFTFLFFPPNRKNNYYI